MSTPARAVCTCTEGQPCAACLAYAPVPDEDAVLLPRQRGRPVRDLTGQTFGRLTPLAYVRRSEAESLWRCACTCGGERLVAARHLRSGQTTSCGCLTREMHAQPGYTPMGAGILPHIPGPLVALGETWWPLTALRQVDAVPPPREDATP